MVLSLLDAPMIEPLGTILSVTGVMLALPVVPW